MPLPDGILIRAQRPADAAGLAALFNQPGFRHGTLRLPFETPEAVAARAGAPNAHAILAERGEAVLGVAGLYRQTGRQAHAGGIGLGVADDWTGQGIGRALLGAIIDLADNWLGLTRLHLTVFVDNAAAIGLYRRFGFEIEGTHRAFALRDGRLVDALAMARLRPAPGPG